MEVFLAVIYFDGFALLHIEFAYTYVHMLFASSFLYFVQACTYSWDGNPSHLSPQRGSCLEGRNRAKKRTVLSCATFISCLSPST